MKTSEAHRAIIHALETLRPLVEELEETGGTQAIPRQIRDIIDALPLPCWVRDDEGRLWHQNEAYWEVYPMGPETAPQVFQRRDEAAQEGGELMAFRDLTSGQPRTVYKISTARLNGGFLIWGISVPKHTAQRGQNEGAPLRVQAG